MRTQIFARIGIAAVALTFAACAEDNDPFSPPTVDSVTSAEAPGDRFGGVIIRPPLFNPEEFHEITAGDYHTCARKANGNVLCWGQEGGPAAIAPVMQTPVQKLTGVMQIDAGRTHTCALKTGGAAWCWGGGNQGQLGLQNGVYTTYNTPFPVGNPINGSTPLAFSTMSAGGYSTCGVAASGTFCWGELGNATNPSTPTAAPTLISAYAGFNTIAVGNRHGCGRIFNNEIYCWGANNFGQSAVAPANQFFHPGTTLLIFAMNTGFGFDSFNVETQQDFTCADKSNGTVQCAGYNQEGQLGNGASGFSASTHVPQTVGGGMQLRAVTTGAYHACALDSANRAWCWGWGLYGQLGNGVSTPIAATPVQVTGGLTFRALAAGRNHTCGVATDNRLYCWGQNNYRQLGTTIVNAQGQVVTNGYSPNPVLVM